MGGVLCTGEEKKDSKKTGMKDGKDIRCFLFLGGFVTAAPDKIIIKLAYTVMDPNTNIAFTFEISFMFFLSLFYTKNSSFFQ